MRRVISEFKTKDMLIRYIGENNGADSAPELMMVPIGMEGRLVPHREDISGQKEAWFFEKWGAYPTAAAAAPLVQICCEGDDYSGGFSRGISMQNSSSTAGLKLIGQQTVRDGERTIVRTELSAPRQLSLIHELSFIDSSSYISCRSSCKNTGNEAVVLEMLSSFTLGMITPFDDADAPERLKLHRFRSGWSAEGRHCAELLEDIGLEPSWSNHGIRSERFGQTGSMPVRKWFPFAAAEDTEAGVFWAVQLDAPASWQIEAYRRDDFLHICGGSADREFGHWSRRLNPGETFTTLPAALTVSKGTFDEACSRLLERQRDETHNPPETEKNYPVVFNEWCTSWGKPSSENIIKSLPRLRDLGIGYYVIDAGWYADENGRWESSMGDWEVSNKLFPDGLAEVSSAIREHGMIPGLWFEFEIAAEESRISDRKDFLLKRNGIPIKSGERFFLDFRRDKVKDYLRKAVNELLKAGNFGYLKIDYNETIGIGCDTEDQSAAEGLRRHIENVQQFIRELRFDIPGIVIENCSSGGHREEPSFIGITDMSSFSDAHELVSIPIIAANLNRLVIPAKCQIWAVLHPEDDAKRLFYSLSAPFLGRMCLSGEIDQLSPMQLEIVSTAIGFYRKAARMISSLNIHRFGPEIRSWKHPRGWQAVLRISLQQDRAFVVVHTFQNTPLKLDLEMPQLSGNWEVDETFGMQQARISGNTLSVERMKDFCGNVIFLKNKGATG